MMGLIDGILGNHSQDLSPDQQQQLSGLRNQLQQNPGYYQQNPDQMQGIFNGILGLAAPFILNYGINAIMNRGQQGGQGGLMPSSGGYAPAGGYAPTGGYAPSGGFGGLTGGAQSPLGGLIAGALPGIIGGLAGGSQGGGLGGILGGQQGGQQGGDLGGLINGLLGGQQGGQTGGEQGGFGEQPPLRPPGSTSL
jgi:hypothetical protein